MQRLSFHRALAAALLGLAGVLGAADFKLKDGTTMSGESVAWTDKGVVIKTEDNKYLPRTAWTNFTQEALKELAKHPKARPFVEPLIDEPAPGDAGAGAEVNVPETPVVKRPWKQPKEPEGRPVPPESPALIAGIFTSGVGWLSLLLCYAATIYAGYEVAVYRRRPRNLVMGLSAIPFLGVASPIAFLIMPPVQTEEEAKPNAVQLAAQQAKEEPKPEEKKGFALGKAKAKAAPAGGAKPVTTKPGPAVSAAPEAAAPSPVKAPAPPAAAAGMQPAVYRKGETNINKRFIETKFAGFFKAIPAAPEKDMWLVWVTATGGEYWSKRVVSISQTELVVNCPQEGGGSLDQTVQIVEIAEIHLRPQEG